MQLVFTKGSGKTDRLDVVREDGSAERIDCPKQGIIPHDMVHFAVESVLATRGFLSSLADGTPATFRPGGEAAEAVERLVEVIQAEAWSGPAEASDLIALYELACEARGHAATPVDVAAITAIRSRMAELTGKWQATAIGDSVTLDFATH